MKFTLPLSAYLKPTKSKLSTPAHSSIIIFIIFEKILDLLIQVLLDKREEYDHMMLCRGCHLGLMGGRDRCQN